MANSKSTSRRTFVTTAALAATVPAALALPSISMPAQAAEPDPIFKTIEVHRKAGAVFISAGSNDDIDERYAPYEAACIALFTTKPTTIEGVAAVLEYANGAEYDFEGQDSNFINTSYENSDGELRDASLNFLSMIAGALRDIAVARREAIS